MKKELAEARQRVLDKEKAIREEKRRLVEAKRQKVKK
jgi:hypothetical protein